MKNTYLNGTKFLLIISLLILMTKSSTAQNKIQFLSEDIMNQIFHKYQYYVIYTYQKQNPKVLKFFQKFCQEYKQCALLNKNVKQYDNIRQFVSFNSNEYFFILDGSNQRKYVINVTNKFQYKDLYNFQAGFTSRSIQPFYSSEEIPEEFYEPCRKLVGNNLDFFLSQSAPIKVVFLYTQIQKCQICGQILRGFADIAQKIYRSDVILFGYIDVFKNDHKLITQEIVPYFLVFMNGQEQPYGIQGQKFPQLETALINIIAQQLNPNYFSEQNNDENNRINIQDLQEIEEQNSMSEQADNIQKNGKNFQL